MLDPSLCVAVIPVLDPDIESGRRVDSIPVEGIYQLLSPTWEHC